MSRGETSDYSVDCSHPASYRHQSLFHYNGFIIEHPFIRSRKKIIVPGLLALAFWSLAVGLWQGTGYWQPLLLFGYIGTALGVGLGLYAGLPRAGKPLGRRVTLFLVGFFLFGFVALMNTENMQLEGLFFGLLSGVFQAAVMHYLIAKIVRPVLFGRLWCGWACWTVMVLDLLPFQRSPGRLPGRWGWLRGGHFGLSLALVMVLFFHFGYRDGVVGQAAVFWFLGGNLLYYGAGIRMAYALKDNRAFCRYLCPITLPLKLTSRFALLKVKADNGRCSSFAACTLACPMDIDILMYAQRSQRVLSTNVRCVKLASAPARLKRSNCQWVSIWEERKSSENGL